MTTNPPSVSVESDGGRKEKLTPDQRHAVYKRMGLDLGKADVLEEMIRRSPNRDVGESALKNVRVDFQSTKNGVFRSIESHTCELAFAYQLELDPTVLGYYTQVPCLRVVREPNETRRSRHVSNPTLDFLVFREASIQIVECKFESWLVAESKKAKSEWSLVDDKWRHVAYEPWAANLGIQFMAWAQTIPFGIGLQNLEACYDLVDEELEPSQRRACSQVAAFLKEGPANLQTLIAMFPSFTARAALWMVAKGRAYAPLRSQSPSEPEHFWLFSLSRQAEEADRIGYRRIQQGTAQPVVADAILLSSTTDYLCAERREARLAAIAEKREPPTPRMTELAKTVAALVAQGKSVIEACLTNYANCGNKGSRLLDGQQLAINTVIKDWNKGEVATRKDLIFRLEDLCKELKVDPPSETTLLRHVRAEDPTIRALATGGLRSYHAARRRTDAQKISLPPLGYGHLLIIDSSDFDTRCAPNILLLFPAEKPKFYIGIDGATGDTMADCLIFGHARTDGLAILIRDYVARHGFLPRVIQVDRGPENTSDWLKTFCRENGIALRHPPTGGSAFNGAAENAIKRVNSQVAHRIAGSTWPDMAGRKVDGKFKSRRTARIDFCEIVKEFREFVYKDMPNTPAADGGTPLEKKEETLATFGCFGKKCAFDDAFQIKTSIPVLLKSKQTEKAGIRTGEGYFTSDELQQQLRTEQPEKAARDCVDPTLMWVRAGKSWFKAYHKRAQSIAMLSTNQKLFELLYGPIVQKEARQKRKAVSRQRYDRQTLAAAASAANEHLAPKKDQKPADGAPGEDAIEEPVNSSIDWEAIEAYDVEG